MSEFRNTLILLVLGLLVYGYLAVYEDSDLPDLDKPRQLTNFPREELREVKVLRRVEGEADEEFVFRKVAAPRADTEAEKRAGEGWSITRGEVTHDTDPASMDPLLRGLAAFEVKRTVSLAPDSLAPYGLEKPRAVIEWKAPGLSGENASERSGVLEFGDPSPVGSLIFMRQGKSGPVFAAESWKANVLLKEPAHYRDRRLFGELVEKDLASIRIHISAGDATRMFRQVKNGEWRIEAPLKAPADGGEVRMLLADLNALRAKDFLGSKPTELMEYGVTDPSITVKLAYRSGITRDLKVGNRDLQKTNRVRVMLGQGAQAVSVEADLLKRLSSPIFSFREKVALRGRLDEIERLTVHAGTRAFEFAKMGGPWKLLKAPEKGLNDQVKVTIDELGLARTAEFLDEPGPLAPYGLSDPEFLVEIPGEEPLRIRISPGAVRRGTFLMIDGEPTVYRMQNADFYQRVKQLVDAAANALAGPPKGG